LAAPTSEAVRALPVRPPKYTRSGSMAAGTVTRARGTALCACLVVLVFASTSGAAARVGIGKMTVVPTRVTAGTTDNELSFAFTADSAALKGTTPGYVELQASGCVDTRIARISSRRIVITTQCPRRHLFRLLYHKAAAPLLSADGFVFLTQTRQGNAPKKVPFRPLGPQKQPVVRVRGAAQAGLFMTITSVATAGVPFGATVRAVDQFGNNAADYAGSVTLTSSDPSAAVPAAYPYAATDAGQHTFTGIVMRTVGTQTVTATDSHGFTIQSPPITVSAS
jgi:hypothetical protein